MVIDSFRGKYFFLSNFYESPVIYEGITYLNNEAAFQAQKTLTNKERFAFAMLNPSQAKKLSRSVSLRPTGKILKLILCIISARQNLLKMKLLKLIYLIPEMQC